VVEHGEHGGAAAAPISAKILRAYFDGKKPVRKDGYGSTAGEDDEEDDLSTSVKAPRIIGDAAND